MGQSISASGERMNQAIYLEIWNYLTALFNCPVEQGLQNNSPLSHDGIVMTLLPYSDALDQPAYSNENGESMIQNSRLFMMQLDFYGDQAFDRANQVGVMWRSQYSTDQLKTVAPLYANQVRNMEYVNEQDQYEQRFMLEIALQYNPHYTYTEQSDTDIQVNINLANK